MTTRSRAPYLALMLSGYGASRAGLARHYGKQRLLEQGVVGLSIVNRTKREEAEAFDAALLAQEDAYQEAILAAEGEGMPALPDGAPQRPYTVDVIEPLRKRALRS